MVDSWRVLVFHKDGICDSCGTTLPSGITGARNRTTKKVRCLEHTRPQPQVFAEPLNEPELSRGTAGRSAKVKYNELHAIEEESIRRRFGRFERLGEVAVFLHEDSQKTTNWSVGSSGEEVVGRKLDSLAAEFDLKVLHDRRRPPTKANIDHLVVTTTGVYVVDTKKYEGEVEVRKPGWFSNDPAQLFINHRNRTKIVKGVRKQVSEVESALLKAEIDMPVYGVLTFVVGPVHIFIVPEKISGVFLSTQRGIGKIICRKGSYADEDVEATSEFLALTFPEA